MSWRDDKKACDAQVDKSSAVIERDALITGGMSDCEANRIMFERFKQPTQQADIVRDAKKALTTRGMTDERADRFLFELFDDIQKEAMRRHYQAGESRESVDAWYAAAVREKLAAEGLT